MKNPWVVIGVIAVVLIGASIWYSGSVGGSYNEGIVLEEGSYVKGNPDATVTLVEYSDFQCPACAAFAPVLEDVFNDFGDQIRFEYKHFPLPIHNVAEAAARAAEAAGQQGLFYEFHDLLFENQRTWSNGANPTVFFVQYAEEIGVEDIDKFKRHLKSSLLTEKIQSNIREGRELGISGTPTFFLNGERMVLETIEDFFVQITSAVTATTTSTVPAEPDHDVRFGL
jgi:protein-disulfide isomerase